MKKKILLVIGTIFLGAIGSGLWEIALSPALSWLGNIIWEMIVQVSSYFEHSVYSDIAESRQETLKMIPGILVIVISILVFSIFFDIKQFINDRFKKIMAITLIVYTFLFWFILMAKNEYTTERREDYAHLLVVVTPYITNHKIDQLNSQFALVQSRNAYHTIIKEMKDIAKDNGVVLPQKYDR